MLTATHVQSTYQYQSGFPTLYLLRIPMVKIGGIEEGCISIGPWGGENGDPWSYKADYRINHIIVRHGWAIDSILFQNESRDGLTFESSEKFGGRGGDRTDKVSIDTAVEHFKTISMTIGDFEGQSVIRSLSFHTNLTEYGPFGKKSGTSVSIPIEGGIICGFHGRARKYINAIGIYVTPNLIGFGLIGSDPDSAPAHFKTLCTTNMMVPRDPGPWGAQRGRHWDDGVFLAIKKVFLRTVNIAAGKSVIAGVRFEYEQRDGKSFSSTHGTIYGLSDVNEIDLYSSGEVILAIEGFYGPVDLIDGLEVMTSITIHTNKRKYGPVGENWTGKYFSSTCYGGGKVVGFFGRSGTYLNAIGVHMQYY